MNRLGLTEEQKPKVAAAQKALDQKLAGFNTAMQAAAKELVDAICETVATPSKLKELVGKASKIESDTLQAKVDFLAELKQILTPDQFKNLAEIIKNRLESPSMGPGFPSEGGPDGERITPGRPAPPPPPPGGGAPNPPPPPPAPAGPPPAPPAN